MSSEEIFSSSLPGKNECELCEKTFTHRKDLLRHQRTIHGEKSFECPLCPYKTARKDNLILHQKVHTKTSTDQTLNRKLNLNETKAHPSSEPKETQHPSNLNRKISHQDPVRASKYSRQETLLIQTIMNNF